ncbi:FMN-dependent NADH-azoreductase [Pseudomonas cavernae]|uniref:FMN dependent NADH:quinone oxidoreductase n=1 Tax=Pseudomonas cavernae TaxID=2320867 RepID=A0A385Z5Y2_9PSED|nr:FMN-dependent NADH-azoreductase [Pseudomonas cavernae]AYC32902.1 FMN-dependent NADH-azoreductase [Pseudomonas cavernae]
MKLLHIDSSILGDASVSRQLSRTVVQAWQASESELQVSYRDLAGDELGHLSAGSLVAGSTPADLRDAAQQHEAARAEAALNEFLAADAIVIAAPMYNFALPSQLKAWIDRITVAGKTFRYTEAGPEGLAAGKQVVIVSTAGGQHAGQPSAAAHEDYLKFVLGFLGITDVRVVRAHGLAMGEQPRAIALQQAQEQIDELFAVAELS